MYKWSQNTLRIVLSIYLPIYLSICFLFCFQNSYLIQPDLDVAWSTWMNKPWQKMMTLQFWRGALSQIEHMLLLGCRSTIPLSMGCRLTTLYFEVTFFEFESLSRSNRQTKSYNGNKANKSNGYLTWRFTVMI